MEAGPDSSTRQRIPVHTLKIRLVGPNDCVFGNRVHVPGDVVEVDAEIATRTIMAGAAVQHIEPAPVEQATAPAARGKSK
jgi:hypothetical protein